MSFISARQFIVAMRGNDSFRRQMRTVRVQDELAAELEQKGFSFDICDLVNAMAECMDESVQQAACITEVVD